MLSGSLYLSRKLSHLVVKGLGRIGSSGSQSDQTLLRTRLTSVLQLVGASVEFSVVSVSVFPSGQSPVYEVELDSAGAVSAILRSFARFTRRHEPAKRPVDLADVTLYNSVTPGTRIRISLLRVSSPVDPSFIISKIWLECVAPL